jgi:hypothetical protein
MTMVAAPSAAQPDASVGGAPAPASPTSRTEPSFWATCGRLVGFGVAVRLLLAPWTSVVPDVADFVEVVRHAMVGIGLYAVPGFSYPPVWGYLLQAGGLAARVLGVGPGQLAGTSPTWTLLAQQTSLFGALVTGPLVTLALKLPLVASDVAVGWLVWRLALRSGASPTLARRAVGLWLWCPVVLWESAVHGTFDTLVALTVAAAVVARLERRFFWCGVAVATGVLTKLTPGFLAPLLLASCLWPLAGEPLERRGRTVLAMAAGGAVATLALVAPVAVSGQWHGLLLDVFARGSVQPSAGGLSLLGIGALPALSWLITWAVQPASGVVHMASVVDGALALGAGLWWWRQRQRSATALITSCGAVLALVVLAGPLANPQYLLWFLPLLASVAWQARSARVGTWLLGAAGVLFEVALRGPLTFLAPLSAGTGVPSAAAIAGQLHAMLNGRLAGLPIGSTLEVGAWLVAMAGFTTAGLGWWVVLHRGGRIEEAGVDEVPGTVTARRRVPRRPQHGRRSAVIEVVGALLVVVPASLGALSSAGEAAVPIPRLTTVAQVRSGRGSVAWRVRGAPPGRLQVSVLLAARPVSVRQVVVYEDGAYPDSGSSPYAVQGVVDHLPVDLVAAHLRVPVRTVGARGLVSVLDAFPASGRVVVVPSGTLPSTVWSPTVDRVTPFVRNGGTLVFGGDLPGYYSVGPSPEMDASPPAAGTPSYECGPETAAGQPATLAPTVSTLGLLGVDRLLGIGGLLETTWGWSCVATDPSPVAAALSLSSATLHAGPSVAKLDDIGGASLGYVTRGRTSIAWVPDGAGGILLFGGSVDGSALASDTARLLAAGGAQPRLAVLGSSDRPQGDLALPSGDHGLVRVAVVARGSGGSLYLSSAEDVVLPAAPRPAPRGLLRVSLPTGSVPTRW